MNKRLLQYGWFFLIARLFWPIFRHFIPEATQPTQPECKTVVLRNGLRLRLEHYSGFSRVLELFRNLGLLGLILLTSACATLDFDQPRTASYALQDTRDTDIGRQVAAVAENHTEDSGFVLLKNGIDALAARLLLIKKAKYSIDAQYYFILSDMTGHLFIHELVKAADRGVRVRLLIDDIATQGYDAGMAALDSHPNFEVRVRNPFSLRIGRYLNVRDYARVNRRMHNKSLIVDNLAIIVGGRNIGDEYFAANKYMNFADLDVFGVGQVAQAGSAVFDDYWNDRYSLPVDSLVKPLQDPAAELAAMLERIRGQLSGLKDTPYANAVRSTEFSMVGIDLNSMLWVPHRLIADPPSKGRDDDQSKQNVIHPISEVIEQAETELLLFSPYFVPRNKGVEAFARLRERGVAVTVLTNSLAATDVAAVHSGYAPSRKPLLKNGVRLYEVRADAKVPGTQRVGIKKGRASLHTKAFIVDRRKIFIGSFNFDPRSVHLNTEMGVFLDAPELAAELSDRVLEQTALGSSTYEVVLNSKNQLRWLGKDDGQAVRLKKEPQAGFWRRFMAGFMRILPIRGQL